MKKYSVFFISYLLLLPHIHAQQNRMWVPGDSPVAYYQMVEQGATFSMQDLYDPEKPSFNDAVVQFNGGCTGGIISPEGLMITNHHCGYGAIQAHSTLDHNYVKDGFWAKNKKEELPNPGMYVTIVRKVINVTDDVLKGVKDEMDEDERQSVITKNIEKVKQNLSVEPWQEIIIKPYLYGNLYYAQVIEKYKDVRLVGAPPSSIGKFGADTDNWMWPRHSGDFSLFRIYADKNNRPADYSPANVPYRPEKYLQVSLDGVKERELIIVYGFPGRTQQYLPSFAIEYITKKINPVRIQIRDEALRIMDKFMRSNDTLKLKYTAQYARIANYWKKWQGENRGIRQSGALENKKYLEQQLIEFARRKNLENQAVEVLEDLQQAYNEMEEPGIARAILVESMYINNDWMRRGFIWYALENQTPEKFAQTRDEYFKRLMKEYRSTDNRVSKALFTEMLAYYRENMPEAYQNAFISKHSPGEWAEIIEKNSVLADSVKAKEWMNYTYDELQEALKNDRGYGLARRLINDYYGKILPDYTKKQSGMNALMRRYTSILMKSGLFPRLVPDANGTLRITFGRVEGYEPRDGMYYEPFTTIDGVIEKYIPGDYEFDLPEEFLKIYEKKDFGPYAVNGTVPVNFLGTAHTTGGNSGSPVLNEKGEMVGLNFDRVWEGTMSDLFYDPKICRNIMVDMRYVMFIIDKLGKAPNLTNEIIHKK